MTRPPLPELRRVARRCGAVGAAALALSLLLAWLAPAAAAPAYRFAVFACLQPAVGLLLLALIYRITGGQWGEAIEGLLRAGLSLAPWIWPLAVPLLFWPHALPGVGEGRAPPATGTGALLLRAVIYEIVLVATGWVARRAERRRLAAPALILLVFTLHFLAADWFFTLEPGWYSTGFPSSGWRSRRRPGWPWPWRSRPSAGAVPPSSVRRAGPRLRLGQPPPDGGDPLELPDVHPVSRHLVGQPAAGDLVVRAAARALEIRGRRARPLPPFPAARLHAVAPLEGEPPRRPAARRAPLLRRARLGGLVHPAALHRPGPPPPLAAASFLVAGAGLFLYRFLAAAAAEAAP